MSFLLYNNGLNEHNYDQKLGQMPMLLSEFLGGVVAILIPKFGLCTNLMNNAAITPPNVGATKYIHRNFW